MIIYSKDIRHFGVLGMKWGVRRYDKHTGRMNKNQDKYDRALSKDMDKSTPKTAIAESFRRSQLLNNEINVQNKADYLTKQLTKKYKAVVKNPDDPKKQEKLDQYLSIVGDRNVVDAASRTKQIHFDNMTKTFQIPKTLRTDKNPYVFSEQERNAERRRRAIASQQATANRQNR